MIKNAILFALLALNSLCANSNIFSNIPPAKMEVINTNPAPCDKNCLLELSKQNRIFSFMARFDRKSDDENLQNLMLAYSKSVGIYYKVRFDLLGEKLKIALLIPKKTIGKYSTTTIDTILAYLAFRDIDFRFKVFDSIDENPTSIEFVLNALHEDDFDFIVAILSKNESIEIMQQAKIPVFIPTLRTPADFDNDTRANIIFGGIDYEAQIEALLDKANRDIIIAYNDDSALGASLGVAMEGIVAQNKKSRLIQETVTNQSASNFTASLGRQSQNLPISNIFLNTRAIISGLILSQINLMREVPKRVFSTQINYNPAILPLLRGINTSNIILANSIGTTDSRLVEYGSLLSSDIKYDWVNYATALGIDLFLNQMQPSIKRHFSEEIRENQVLYKTNLYKIENNIFVRY